VAVQSWTHSASKAPTSTLAADDARQAALVGLASGDQGVAAVIDGGAGSGLLLGIRRKQAADGT